MGEVFSQVESLAAVKPNPLTARLEHVVAANMALQDELRVAPASRHMLVYLQKVQSWPEL